MSASEKSGDEKESDVGSESSASEAQSETWQPEFRAGYESNKSKEYPIGEDVDPKTQPAPSPWVCEGIFH